jgi:hypothetical protein
MFFKTLSRALIQVPPIFSTVNIDANLSESDLIFDI